MQWQLDHVEDAIYQKGDEPLQSYIQHLIKAPFDLSKDHMLRASLVNIDKNEHVLVVTMHHIAADGWSMSILVKEVVELYGSYNENEAIQLAQIPVQICRLCHLAAQLFAGRDIGKQACILEAKAGPCRATGTSRGLCKACRTKTKGAVAGFRIDKEDIGPASTAKPSKRSDFIHDCTCCL